MGKLKDYIIRKIAMSFLFRWADGHKTEIFRVVQTVNSILITLYLVCPHVPAVSGMDGCAVVDILNAKWLALSVALGQLGLEFGIQDAKAKSRMGLN